METGQETTVTMVGFAGAVTAVLLWLLSFFAPALMMTAPPGLEAAFTTILACAVCYLAPAWKMGGAKPPAP